MKGIADTGFIVAYGNRADRHHEWALDVARKVSSPLLTCEAVVAESVFHLASASYVFSLIEAELIALAFDCGQNLAQLRELAERYRDRNPDFADLCIIRMSELHPRHPVITVDEHDFRIYKRNKREAIPMVCPPRHH